MARAYSHHTQAHTHTPGLQPSHPDTHIHSHTHSQLTLRHHTQKTRIHILSSQPSHTDTKWKESIVDKLARGKEARRAKEERDRAREMERQRELERPRAAAKEVMAGVN